QWDRNYGSSGWIYYGVPFTGILRSALGSDGQQIYMNKYVESSGGPSRWVTVGGSETLGLGTGYIIAMATQVNDTIGCSGQPQVDAVPVNGLTYTTTNGSWFDYQRGYNLVANPYTAPISI